MGGLVDAKERLNFIAIACGFQRGTPGATRGGIRVRGGTRDLKVCHWRAFGDVGVSGAGHTICKA